MNQLSKEKEEEIEQMALIVFPVKNNFPDSPYNGKHDANKYNREIWKRGYKARMNDEQIEVNWFEAYKDANAQFMNIVNFGMQMFKTYNNLHDAMSELIKWGKVKNGKFEFTGSEEKYNELKALVSYTKMPVLNEPLIVLTRDKKKELLGELTDLIKKDASIDVTNMLEDLLKRLPDNTLIEALPEEAQVNYK